MLNLLEKYQACSKRDAWHSSKSEETCKIFGSMIVDAVKGSHDLPI